MSILFPSYSMGMFSLIVMILSLPILSLIIRRLHDSERKGSWILLIVAPLLIAMATWTYSTFFFSKGDRKEKEVSKMIQYDETENLDIYVMANGDTVKFSPNDLAEALRTRHNFQGTHNGEPITIDPAVFNVVKGDQRIFYGTAGIVSFLFVFWIIGSIILIVLCSAPGTEGPNRYGPNPKAVQ